jgi:hypothetical protein
MNGARRAAILVCSLLAAPGSRAIGADIADAAKPKAKACKKGTTKIRLGKGRRGHDLLLPADVPGQGGFGMVHSHAHYALTFEQLPPS